MKNRKRYKVTLTWKQWDEIRFALDVQNEIYRQNPGRAKLARYCAEIWESIQRQISKAEGQ